MTSEEFEMIASDGVELHAKTWKPDSEDEPTSVLCLVHGFAEHLGRYESVAEYFVSQGMVVMSFDHRGHGKSPGKRGHAPNFDQLIDDVEQLLIEARRSYNDALLFLFGQSFGGNVVANYLTKRNTSEVAGAILSAPWFRLAFKPPAIKMKLARIMKGIYPGYSEKSSIKSSELTKDEVLASAYDNDPLVHDNITAATFFNIVTYGEAVISNAFKLTIPMMLIHGKEDRITSWKASEEFAHKAGEKCSLRLYDNLRHEPLNEVERETVLEGLMTWISHQSK